MELLGQMLKKIETLRTTATSGQQVQLTTQNLYSCQICKDDEFIFINSTTVRECECREREIYQRILESSGISGEYQKIGFKNFRTDGLHENIKNAKESAITYTKNFESIRHDRKNSIAFLASRAGEKKIGIGCGKTHLSIAIANNLMSRNIGVLYMPYVEAITRLKQLIKDDETYSLEINRFKNASVLLIDDLFKCKFGEKPTAADIKVIFDIINHRYLAHGPIIVSSEWCQQDLIDLDEAIGSRIIEMSKDYLIEFRLTPGELNKGISLNYRLIA